MCVCVCVCVCVIHAILFANALLMNTYAKESVEDVYMCVCGRARVNEKHISYLIEALPEWSKAKMIRFQLMNIQGSAT